MPMLKKVMMAAAVTGLVAGAMIPVHSSPAEAAKSGCFKAAKVKFPADYKARRDYRKWCRSEWKAYKGKSHMAAAS